MFSRLRGHSLRSMGPDDFIPGVLHEADMLFFLPRLQSLMNQPTLLGKFPADQYKDVLSYNNAV